MDASPCPRCGGERVHVSGPVWNCAPCTLVAMARMLADAAASKAKIAGTYCAVCTKPIRKDELWATQHFTVEHFGREHPVKAHEHCARSLDYDEGLVYLYTQPMHRANRWPRKATTVNRELR